MNEDQYIVLVRMPSGCVVAIRDEDDDQKVFVFNSEKAIYDLMEKHILGKLPYQIVTLEV